MFYLYYVVDSGRTEKNLNREKGNFKCKRNAKIKIKRLGFWRKSV